jgi:hypothetical protein
MAAELANVVNEVANGAKVSTGNRHGERGTGIHFYIDFPNGYRLSIVNAYGTYDTEVGLFDPSGEMEDTDIFGGDCVEGWVDEDRLKEIIVQVAAL